MGFSLSLLYWLSIELYTVIYKGNLPLKTGLLCNKLQKRAREKPKPLKNAGTKVLEIVGRVSQLISLVNNSKSELVEEFPAILIGFNLSIIDVFFPNSEISRRNTSVVQDLLLKADYSASLIPLSFILIILNLVHHVNLMTIIKLINSSFWLRYTFYLNSSISMIC